MLQRFVIDRVSLEFAGVEPEGVAKRALVDGYPMQLDGIELRFADSAVQLRRGQTSTRKK